MSTNGPLQRPIGQFECLSSFSVISCFFKCVIFVDHFLQILRVLHLRTPNSKAMVCIGTICTALRRAHVATCSLNKKCFKKYETKVHKTTNKTQIDLQAAVVVRWWIFLALRNPELTFFWQSKKREKLNLNILGSKIEIYAQNCAFLSCLECANLST